MTENTPPSAERAPQVQGELPFAIVGGEVVETPPTDLYVPPQALRVFLTAFEGPLDLLLYLVRRENVDILKINLFEVTDQYLRYIDLMENLEIELAAEYLVMAATLAEYKSRMLLPRPEEEEEETDPRAELIARLLEYERFKQVAREMEELPRMERENFQARAEPPPMKRERPLPQVELRELLVAMANVLHRMDARVSHQVELESLSTRERMSQVVMRLEGGRLVSFEDMCSDVKTRNGVVVTFIALLELVREDLVELKQVKFYGPIYIRQKTEAKEGETSDEKPT